MEDNFPVKGYCVSAKFTCPGCGKLLDGRNIHRFNGVIRCGWCRRLLIVSLNVWRVAGRQGAASVMFPDSVLPAERQRDSRRHQSRRARVKMLRELGMADPMPDLPYEKYQNGMLGNTTGVVNLPDPDSP